jgi:FkbM family methyltransferase
MTAAGRSARALFDVLVRSNPRRVRVLGGVARGARLELDLTREKAYWLGRYELPVQDAMRRYVGPGSVVYDVGAHLGFFAVAAATLGARVYAFEAAPENAARIRRHALLNGAPIEVVEGAVWDVAGTVGLRAGDSDREWRTHGAGSLQTVVLDEFVVAHELPTLVKIDVEGAEVHVLRGAGSLLRTSRPVVICELHGEPARTEALELLSGYELHALPNEWRVLAVPKRPSVDSPR